MATVYLARDVRHNRKPIAAESFPLVIAGQRWTARQFVATLDLPVRRCSSNQVLH